MKLKRETILKAISVVTKWALKHYLKLQIFSFPEHVSLKVDLWDIKQVYNQKYGISLAEQVKRETGGSYRKLLLAVLTDDWSWNWYLTCEI